MIALGNGFYRESDGWMKLEPSKPNNAAVPTSGTVPAALLSVTLTRYPVEMRHAVLAVGTD